MPIRYPQPGSVLLGKYCVDSLIGEGGMGAVLKARHLDLEEFVAIKVLLPDHAERTDIVARFLREAKASVKLKGEHVARVLDVGRLDGEWDDTPYIVMEYLDGADLNAIIKHHGAQDPAIAVDLILQACEAIAEAHSLGIIHRDIKASNFFVTQSDGQSPHLKVLDFGIATAPQGTSDLTNTQSVIGTPAYMAPEQMRASRTADARSDIWSMGVVLYELLEGARPFRSTVYSDLCLMVGIDPPTAMVQEMPEALHQVVMKCLDKSVERRYQSVAELAFDLMPFASDMVLARAAVEQCARMLGRRSQRVFDATRAPDDITPPPMTPPRLTPTSLSMAGAGDEDMKTSATPSSIHHSTRRTGALTPVPPVPGQKTPTSINASNGQVQVAKTGTLAPTTPRRRGLIVAGSFLATAALGAGLVFTFAPGKHQDTSVQPATEPAVPEHQPVLKPVPEPTPTKEPVVVKDPVPAEKDPAPLVKDDPVKEPVKEPIKEPVKDPVVIKEPAKEPIKAATEPAKKPPVHVVVKPPIHVAKATPKPPTPKKDPKTDPKPDPKPDPPSDDDVYKVRR